MQIQHKDTLPVCQVFSLFWKINPVRADGSTMRARRAQIHEHLQEMGLIIPIPYELGRERDPPVRDRPQGVVVLEERARCRDQRKPLWVDRDCEGEWAGALRVSAASVRGAAGGERVLPLFHGRLN
jgi:hypothetical protein